MRERAVVCHKQKPLRILIQSARRKQPLGKGHVLFFLPRLFQKIQHCLFLLIFRSGDDSLRLVKHQICIRFINNFLTIAVNLCCHFFYFLFRAFTDFPVYSHLSFFDQPLHSAPCSDPRIAEIFIQPYHLFSFFAEHHSSETGLSPHRFTMCTSNLSSSTYTEIKNKTQDAALFRLSYTACKTTDRNLMLTKTNSQRSYVN